MIDPQEIAAVTKEIPGLAKAIETSGILLSVVIFCVLIFMIVKLVVTIRFKGKNGSGRIPEGLNPGYVAQVQNHMAGAIAANTKIESIDKNTDELCKCMAVLANNQAQQTMILGKISDNQIALTEKISFDK